MAYILGFFAADGCMFRNNRGAHFIEFHITDKDILEKIREVLGSNHKISIRQRNDKWKTIYRLQIGSKVMFDDLISLGMTPQKSNTLQLPNVPNEYFHDFVRGYFDGDGNAYANSYQRKGRKGRSVTLLSGFTCGSKSFLEKMHKQLKEQALLSGGTLYCREGCYRLYYSVKDSCKLYKFMYNTKVPLYLDRKKTVFEAYFEKTNQKFLCLAGA